MASYQVSMGIGSNSKRGYNLGFSTFTMKAGQALVVEYEVKERKSGYLTVYVWEEPGLSFPKIIDSFQIKEEGKGLHRFQAKKTGSYRIDFSPSPDGNRYDFSYEARWRMD